MTTTTTTTTTPAIRDPFCPSCGAAYGPPATWPRTCPQCHTKRWENPIPVTIVLVPVERDGRTGLLVVRRAIEPRRGFLGLVGGFLEAHETWQEGGVREVREETGVIVDPATLTTFWFASTSPRPNRVLLFSVAAPLPSTALVPFVENEESSERGLIFGPGGLDGLCAFPLHAEACRRYFAERGITGDADYTPC